jgi:transaldolase
VVIYLDSGSLEEIEQWKNKVAGFTTNPSLCKHVSGYMSFAKAVIGIASGKPLSLEVLSDDLQTMESQARDIASWGDNIFVKIPITNSEGQSTAAIIRYLSSRGFRINVTALTSFEQIEIAGRSLIQGGILSIFCGRIADTGRDPVPFILKAQLVKQPDTKVLWASCREPYNIKQAEQCACDIITASAAILSKRRFGQDLNELSLETVRQFARDAQGIIL